MPGESVGGSRAISSRNEFNMRTAILGSLSYGDYLEAPGPLDVEKVPFAVRAGGGWKR
jgi:hypothetical protein